MLDQELHQSIDTRLKDICGENYLFGLHWCGHPEIPSNLKNGESVFWAVMSTIDDLFQYQKAMINDECLSQLNTRLICTSADIFFDYLRANPTGANQLKEMAWSSKDFSINHPINQKDAEKYCLGLVAKRLMEASSNYISNGSSQMLLQATAQNASLPHNLDSNELFDQLFQKIEFENKNRYRPEGAPPIPFSAPIAIYQNLDVAILVSTNPLEVMRNFDQKAWASWLDKHSFSTVQVVYPNQLIQSIKANDMLGYRLLSYEHIWGQDILESITLDLETLILNAAQTVSNLSVWHLGGSLCDFSKAHLSPQEFEGKLVHDLQNRILNVQLQNELLSRFKLTPKGNPDVVIPGREAPTIERLQAICETFSWWSSFYLSLIDEMDQ